MLLQSKYINCNDIHQRPTNEHQPGVRPNLLLTPDSNLEQWPQWTKHPGRTFKPGPCGEESWLAANFCSRPINHEDEYADFCTTKASSLAPRTMIPARYKVCVPSLKHDHRPQRKKRKLHSTESLDLVCFGKANRTLSSIDHWTGWTKWVIQLYITWSYNTVLVLHKVYSTSPVLHNCNKHEGNRGIEHRWNETDESRTSH